MDIVFKLLDFNIWSLLMEIMTFGIIYPKLFGPPNSDSQNYWISLNYQIGYILELKPWNESYILLNIEGKVLFLNMNKRPI